MHAEVTKPKEWYRYDNICEKAHRNRDRIDLSLFTTSTQYVRLFVINVLMGVSRSSVVRETDREGDKLLHY